MASAEVQIDSSGTTRPLRLSRAARSRRVYIELLVSRRNGASSSVSRATNSGAPGNGCSSCTSTPSMSISHERISREPTSTAYARRAAAGG